MNFLVLVTVLKVKTTVLLNEAILFLLNKCYSFLH